MDKLVGDIPTYRRLQSEGRSRPLHSLTTPAIAWVVIEKKIPHTFKTKSTTTTNNQTKKTPNKLTKTRSHS